MIPSEIAFSILGTLKASILRGFMVVSVGERTFTKEVIESSTLVVVTFWAPWCRLCQIVEPLLSRFQAEWEEPIKLVRINADENFKLAKDYRLTTLPTLLMFENGQLRHRLDGFQAKDELRASLERLMSLKSYSA